MDHKTREFYPLSDRLKPGYGLHGNSVTVRVVKNVVVNMESVLADLKGIMGEITTIVEHIDTVTGRTGKHNKAGNGNRDLSFSKYDFGKILCGKYSESKFGKIYPAVSPEADNKSVTESSHMNNVSPSHNVLKVKGVSQHHDFQSDKQQQNHTATHFDGATSLEWKNSSKLFSLSREMNHMVNVRSGIKPYNGAIAVVRPTIVNSHPGKRDSENKETSGARNSGINTNITPAMPNSENEETSGARNSGINTNSTPAMPNSENKEISGTRNSGISKNSPPAMTNSEYKETSGARNSGINTNSTPAMPNSENKEISGTRNSVINNNSPPAMPNSENKEISGARDSGISKNSPPAMPNSENKETSGARNSWINTNSPPAMPNSENKETSGSRNSGINTNSPPAMPNSSTEPTTTQKSIACISNTSDTQTFSASSVKANSEMTSQDLREGEYKQNEDEQKRDNACSMYRHTLCGKQLDQAPSEAKEKQHSHSQLSRNMCTSLEAVAESFEKPNAREHVKSDKKYSRDLKAQLNSSASSTSHRSVASTEEVDFLPKRSQPCHNQELTVKNPLTRHSSLKSVYSKVQSSPASVKSLDTRRGSDTKNYFYSTESDGDSDYCIENHDLRSITPDLDWSYLNLIGSGNAQVSITMVADTNRHVRASERCNSYSISCRQTSADAEEITDGVKTFSVLETKETFNNLTPVHVLGYRMMSSLVPIHVFCSEVSSFQSVGYCGYYEAILDSVLENIAGFESFEEACESIENIETLNEVYASCDTEFEEDDWYIGMKSCYQDKCPLPPSDIRQLECLHLENLERLDRNQNILAANTLKPNKHPGNDYENRKITCALPRTTEIIDKVLDAKRNNKLTSLSAEYEREDSLNFSERRNTFADDDGTIQMGISNPNQNLIFRPESIRSAELKLRREPEINTATSDKESDRSSSDATSCHTDGSPMSVSSSEITCTSQETGQVESASEDDDLNSSQEDSVSLSAEIGTDTQLFIHKAKLKKLRRAFFQSLYRNFDEKEMETDDNYSVTSLDDTTSLGQSLTRLDNNHRDNVSEPESYLDNVTGYNQSINTWTAYALVDLQTDDMSDSASDVF